MKQYKVVVQMEVFVEAEDEQSAIEQATDVLSEQDIFDMDCDITVDELQ